jgi:hypothetical protein
MLTKRQLVSALLLGLSWSVHAEDKSGQIERKNSGSADAGWPLWRIFLCGRAAGALDMAPEAPRAAVLLETWMRSDCADILAESHRQVKAMAAKEPTAKANTKTILEISSMEGLPQKLAPTQSLVQGQVAAVTGEWRVMVGEWPGALFTLTPSTILQFLAPVRAGLGYKYSSSPTINVLEGSPDKPRSFGFLRTTTSPLWFRPTT